MRPAVSLVLAGLLAGPLLAQTHVAPTEAKSPADERKSFQLPPGFEAQLVAAEPDIGKPIQLAFDARGRLWVTTSRHYPFPAAAGEKPSDKLYVLADFAPDGKARQVTVFADDLNIPIGVLPLPDGTSCLVSHVGEILKLTDTNGDGRADRRETLFTGFGTEDTHGMTNSFLLLPDGWVYATHGFKNTSVVRAKDGSTVTMNSGNTYRFRPDGSRIEPWSFGQVNPFGLTVDPWLNLYTADCHSKPITQILRGAYYDSFGKPHDGLGFAPHVTRHDHKSTALCGLAWYDADHFPKEWNGAMFLGNVTGNRINCDRIDWKGSTPLGQELPDFLVSSDPWFRPTDIKLGPDGALYVADFYNRIIGHYEVDLRHPGRDKDRGRVWRIVWKGTDGTSKPPAMPSTDWAKADTGDLVAGLIDPNLSVRLTAALEILRREQAGTRIDLGAGKPGSPLRNPDVASTAVGLWALAREAATGPIHLDIYRDAINFAKHSGQELKPEQHSGLVVRALASRSQWGAPERSLALECLKSFDTPRVRRAVVEAFIAHPHPENVAPLVQVIQSCPAEDTHLRHAARIALRNALREPGGWEAATKAAPAVIADVAAGVPSREAAGYLLTQLRRGRVEPFVCEHIGRYGNDEQAAAVVAILKEKPAPVFAVQALLRGLQARGGRVPPETAEVAEMACARALDSNHPIVIQAAIDLAAGLKLTRLFPMLAVYTTRPKEPEPQRAAALAALMAIDAAKAIPILGRTLTDPAAPPALRERAALTLAGSGDPTAREALLNALANAPTRLAVAIATGLASSPQGTATLLDAVRQGKASARLLQEKGVAVRIALHERGKFRPQVEELTRGLPSVDARLEALLRSRAEGFTRGKPEAGTGQQVFTKHCAACHQIGGQGQKVGPQLDGIGNRGLERVLEDILDPNRNVDAAFRATTIQLLDGRTLTGLFLRDEGQVTVLAGPDGKEIRVSHQDIDKKTTTPLSPMPANFDTAIPEAEFYHLVAYLLEQRAKDAPKR